MNRSTPWWLAAGLAAGCGDPSGGRAPGPTQESIHDDGHVHDPRLLRLRFEDLDRDGTLDLVVEGEARETDPPFTTTPVRARVRVDAATGALVLLDQEGPSPIAW